MKDKLEAQHKHIMRLIARDCDDDGWAVISEQLYLPLSENMPDELMTFEKLEVGGRARLTEEGNNVLSAMDWL